MPPTANFVVDYGMIYIYYRHRTEQSLRVRTFIDFMVERMAGNRNFFLDPQALRATQPPQRKRAALGRR